MDSRPHASLTDREQEVSLLLLDGLNVIDIATRLAISVETARTHVKRQHAKTETHSLHSLVLWASIHRSCCLGAEPPGSPEAPNSDDEARQPS